jgi:thiol-disulfide isomerase/thioredoxin
MRSRQRVLTSVLAGLLVTALTGSARPDPPPNPPAPAVALPTLDGRSVQLTEFAGKVVLLDFWATWCGPCRRALPGLKKLREGLRQEPFVLVGVGCDLQQDKVKDFVRSNQMDWLQAWDDTGEVQKAFHIQSLPTYFVLDASGKIVFSAAGWSPEIESHIRTEVEKAVGASQATPTTKAQ